MAFSCEKTNLDFETFAFTGPISKATINNTTVSGFEKSNKAAQIV